MRCVFLLHGSRGGKQCGGPAPYLSSSHQYKHLMDILMRLEEKDFFCGHLPFSDTISKILDDCDIRIIQSLRDPRDVLASQLAFALNNPEHFLHQTLQKLDSDTEQQRLILQGSLAGKSLHRSLSTQYREM